MAFEDVKKKRKEKEEEKGVKLFSNFRIFHVLRQNIKKMPTLQLFATRVRERKKHWNQTTYRSLTGPCASLGRIPTVTARARIFRGVGSMIHLKWAVLLPLLLMERYRTLNLFQFGVGTFGSTWSSIKMKLALMCYCYAIYK